MPPEGAGARAGVGADISVRHRGRGFAPHTIPGVAWASFAILIALWQVGSSTGVIPDLVLPSPAAVVIALWKMTVSGELWRSLGASLFRLIAGWALGTVCGIALGFAIGVSGWARSSGSAIVSALFPIPKIALVPLFIIWFGIGETSKVITIAFGVFFPTVISTYSAIDNVPPSLIRMGQSFDLATGSILRKIILPGALPGILSGFRISSSIAIVLLVAAEMIGADSGIGALILSAGNLYQIDRLLAGVVVLSVLGLVIAALVTRLERALLSWR